MPTEVPPPQNKGSKKDSKGVPPSIEQTRSNLQKPEPGGLVDLNFKVPAEFRKDFKIAAVTQGMNQAEFLKEIFRFWSERNG